MTPMKGLKGPLLKVCWARSLGDCGGGLSGEHVVSNGLFDGGMIEIVGGPWTEGDLRTFGRNQLKRRILCRKHNSALSPVDQEGIRTFRAIRRLDDTLAASRGRAQGVKLHHRVVGPTLERWFLKTAINLFVVGGGAKTWEGGARPSDPPSWLVRATFGHETLAPPRGLYNWAGDGVGAKVALTGEVSFAPFYLHDSVLVGARFSFHGLSFLVWFSGAPLPWPRLRVFHRHIGGQLRDGLGQADLIVQW